MNMWWLFVIGYVVIGWSVMLISNRIMHLKGFAPDVLLLWPIAVVCLILLAVLTVVDKILESMGNRKEE